MKENNLGENVEEAAERYAKETKYISTQMHFKAGAKWYASQKEGSIQKAIEWTKE